MLMHSFVLVGIFRKQSNPLAGSLINHFTNDINVAFLFSEINVRTRVPCEEVTNTKYSKFLLHRLLRFHLKSVLRSANA